MTDSFPPHSWLGFGLDMTSITPTDITTVILAPLLSVGGVEYLSLYSLSGD